MPGRGELIAGETAGGAPLAAPPVAHHGIARHGQPITRHRRPGPPAGAFFLCRRHPRHIACGRSAFPVHERSRHAPTLVLAASRWHGSKNGTEPETPDGGGDPGNGTIPGGILLEGDAAAPALDAVRDLPPSPIEPGYTVDGLLGTRSSFQLDDLAGLSGLTSVGGNLRTQYAGVDACDTEAFVDGLTVGGTITIPECGDIGRLIQPPTRTNAAQ